MTRTQTLETKHTHNPKSGKSVQVLTPTIDNELERDAEGYEVGQQRHPLGVKPSGNALTSDRNLAQAMGIWGSIPDALVLLILEYLDSATLWNLGKTCRGLFAYASHDQLWRDLSVREHASNLTWHGSWRKSCLRLSSELPNVDCSSLFSDALYRPFQCSQICFSPYIKNIPNKIATLPDLTREEFARDWTNRPFILTDPVKSWRVFEDWDEERLLARYADIEFRAEAVDWTLQNYFEYMHNTADESPLYLFDRSFVEKMGLDVAPNGSYEPPECFKDDLFTLLAEHRPDHRWLIIGPERSGSTFHKDPNATSAWNAVIRGSKYWLMFPNSVMPPGVYVSEDQSEVTSPLSIAEWLLTFHEEARRTPGCVEGICKEGEVLHVPSGWWHLVVNLEPAIAITQNFVPGAHLKAAVNFLKYKPDQVSGFKDGVADPHALFVSRLQETYPDLYESLQPSTSNKRKWADVTAKGDESGRSGGGFSFGFSDDTEEVD